MRLEGTITALITPFSEQKIDVEGLQRNIHHQISSKVNGILVLGTTGEASTLSHDERECVIEIAITEAAGRIPVWVGTGSNCTRQTIANTVRAKALGADIALIVAPYYNKPGQEGIFRHFEEIANSVDIPIIIYNIPSRCGVNIETATLCRIATLPNVLGVKEASGNINHIGDLLNVVKAENSHFRVFSGDDAFTLPLMALGAVGVVSVVSNLIPARVTSLVNAALAGCYDIAREIHHQLLPLYKAAFVETNPMPIKAAMSLCGMASGGCRLPLCDIGEENMQMLQKLLEEMELLPYSERDSKISFEQRERSCDQMIEMSPTL